MVTRNVLKEVLVWKDDEGHITSQKGTQCSLVIDGAKQWVEKEWVSGDWLFTADYQYGVEKSLYEQCGARGLSVPRLIDADDQKKILYLEYIEGPKLKPQCRDNTYLLPVLTFFDVYKDLTPSVELWPITGTEIRDYNFKCITYAISDVAVQNQVDQIFLSFLDDVQLDTIPFDAILKNVIVGEKGLCFIDFEWTIAGPYELALARLAAEFNCYDHDLIMARVTDLTLYYLFLLQFYMQGRWPETMYPYFRANLEMPALQELFRLINVHKYADEVWCI